MKKPAIAVLIAIALVIAQVDITFARAGSGSSSKSSSSKSSGSSSSYKSTPSSSGSGSAISPTKSSSPPSSQPSYKKSSSYGNTAPKSAPSASTPDNKPKYGNTATPSTGVSTTTSPYNTTLSEPKQSTITPEFKPKYGNTATPSVGTTATTTSTAPASDFDRTVNKSISKEKARESLSRYETEKSKYKAPPPTATSTRPVYVPPPATTRSYSPDTYAYRRDTFYSGAGYRAPPYAYNSFHSFGVWDGLFLWFLLDNISKPQYSQMFYNHQNDPGFQQWRQEADRLGKENSQLKGKLNTLDTEVAKLKGTPVDPKYVPPDVAPDIMMAKGALEASKAKQETPKKEETKSGSGWGGILLLGLIVLGVFLLIKARRKMAHQPKYRL